MRNRKVFALVGSFALILGLSVSLLPAGAGADTPPPPGPTIDAGQLRLHMFTDGNSFSYTPAVGTPVTTQPISQSQKCGYSSGTNLVRITSEGGSVGFSRSNAQLGVDSRDGATKCTQVNVSPEKLILELVNDAGSAMAGQYATHANLDVELKFNPLVTVTAFKDGAFVWDDTYDCTTSDCGPDRDSAGDNNFIRFPISGTVLFDKLEITATATGGSTTSAGVSLEGGNDLYQDGTRKDSIFFMAQEAEGEICPGQTIHEPTSTGDVAVEYLGATGPCKDYLLTYTRDPDTNERRLEYLLSEEGTPATFEVRINAWDPEPVANPVPSTLVDPPLPSHPAEWCEGTASSPTVPTGEVWCLVTQSTSTYGPDGDGSPENPDWVPGYDGQLMQVTETYILIGDAGCKR